MATIADLLGTDVRAELQQTFELPISQDHDEVDLRDGNSPRKPPNKTNTKTHLWKGKPVTEKQFAHYARMSHKIPENSGSRAVFEVEQMLKPQPKVEAAITLLVELVRKTQEE